MTEAHRLTTDWFTKPGDTIRAMLQRREISVVDLGNKFDGGIETLRGLCDGSVAIDVATAKSLENHIGGTQSFWLRRQANYEDALEQAVNAALVSETDEWLEYVPSPTGSKVSLNANENRRRKELRNRLAFFNVAKFSSWEKRYGDILRETRFRTSSNFVSNDDSVLRWLRRGELEADLVVTKPWNAENLRDRVDEIRKLCRVSQPVRFLPRLTKLFAEVGVALVVVRAPQGCRASGASRLVDPDKAMILMSFRYRSDDHFWFTLFHEIAHLILHGAKTFVDEDMNSLEDESEREANEFASSCIVPINRVEELEDLRTTRDAIIRYSVSLGISPGLVVGQMQHRGLIEYNRLNHLKRRWSWQEISPAVV